MNLRVRIVHPFSDMVADSVFVRRGGGGDGMGAADTSQGEGGDEAERGYPFNSP